MSDFFRNSSKLVNRFTLILATAGLLVALFTIAGSQGSTVSGAPEFDAYLLMAGNSEPPTVAVKALGSTSTSLSDLVTVSEGDTVQLVAELTNAPEGGASQDITVHLATGNVATASESDYSYPVRVTIPQGQSRVEFEVRADQDDLVEDAETLNIYVSSVDYASQNYEQSDSGVDVTIIEVYNYRPTVAVRPVGSSKVYEGYSRWLVAELTNVPLGGTLEEITVNLATGEASMASEYDYRYPSSVKIPRGKSQARFRVWGLDDDFREDIETLNVHVSSVDYRGQNYEQSDSGADLTITSYGGYKDSSSVPGGSHNLEDTPIRIEIDNDNDEELPSVVIRPLSFSAVYEGVSKWLELELTNRSEDNLVWDMTVTVHLATSNITTSDSDYSYPGSVMIPPGQNRVRFEVRTILDDLVEDSETLRIYASSIDYGGYNYRQSDLGINLIIFDIDDDSEVPPTVVVRPASDTSLPLISLDGIDRTSIIEGGELSLEVELTNASRGGTLRDITVHLAAGSGTTANASDYNLPATVTIPAGSVRGFFTVSARRDALVENGEMLTVYVSSVDYGGYNYEQSDSGLNLRIFDDLEPPIVRVKQRVIRHEREGVRFYLDVNLINPPKGGTDRPMTVHLASRDIGTTESDYSYQSQITLRPKYTYGWTVLHLLPDGFPEFDEAVNFYVSSVDYGGRSYEQSDSGLTIEIINSANGRLEYLDSAITVQGGTEHPEGTTVTVGVHLKHWRLSADAPDDSVRLEFALRGNVGARAVEVDGQPFVLESDEWPFYVDITEGLRGSSVTEVQFYLPDDYLPEQTGQVDLRLVTHDRGDLAPGYEARAFFRVVDDDEQPTVVLPDTDSDEPPIVAVRPISSTIVDDEQLLLLAVELTNAPEDGAAEDITVHLGIGIGTTAFGGGYNYPSSVTIPQGQSRVEFEVRAFNDYRDWIYKYDPIKDTWRRSSVRDWNLNIYARSVELGGRNYKQFDSGADFIIINHTELRASIRIRDGVNQPERSTVTVHVDLFKTLPTGFLPDNLVQLSFTPSGAEPFVVDITEALKGTGEVDVPAYFTGDYIPGGSNLVNVKFTVANQDNRPRSSRNKAFFRIVDKDIPPIVSLKVQPGGNWLPEALKRPPSDHSYVLENGAPYAAVLVAELLNAPEGGALQDLIVHLGVGSESTASESDYSFLGYPRIRIEAGSVLGYSSVWPEFDRVVEYSETIHIYVSSVEYLGQHHEQPNERVVVEIHNYNTTEPPIESSITVLGGADHLEGTTVTVRVGLKKDTPWVGDSSIQMLPEGTPANAIELVFSMSGSVHIVDITEALRDSTYVDVPFYLTDDLLLEQTERVDLRVRATYDPLRRLLSEAQSFFRIVDDGEHLEVVPDTLTAQLSGSSLILYEDRAVTFEVELSGYLSSLVDGDTTTLTIEARPVEGRETGSILADLNDYELTPVTINKRAKLATFEIRTIDDSDYDPRESVLLELVSHSDDVEIGSPNTLNLEIRNNDPKPLISFATTLTTGRDSDGENFIEIPEGDKGTFRVELDRKSNRDVRVYVYLGPRAPQLWGGGVTYSRYIYYGYGGQSYYDNRGYYPGALNFQYVIEPGALVIPAGELGLTFTIDTTSLANDLYDYIQEDYLGTAFLYTISSAYTDERNGKVNFRVVQDEPIPELSFKSDDDGDATITVREGESFDVRVDIDPPLGRYNRAWNNVSLGLKLASQLIATTVTGEVPAWELPDIEIVPGQSGVTVTVQIPADGLANGERTVALDFEDALLSYTNGDQTVPARIKNSLVVTILDEEPPVVVEPPIVAEAPEVRIEYISGRVRSITEGNSITPRVALTGDSIGGLEQDLVVNFAIKDGATASQSDYSYPSSVTIPAGATSAPFALSATADDLIEYNETFNIYISSLDYNGENYDTEHAGVEFTIKSPDRIWKTIEKLPSSSWIEGGTANIRVGLTDRLPSDVPANSLFLTIGDGYDDIDITEQLKSSTEVDLSIPLNDNSLRATNEQLRIGLQFQKSQIPFLSRGGVVRINVADDEEPPQVVVRRNSRGRTSTISEGGRVQLTALAPGVAPVDLVVSLAAGMSTTLASSDYDFPASVTIPKGQRSVRFWVDTSDDEQAEYADILNIRPTSVVYGSHTHPLSDTGVDLTVNSSDRIGAAVDILGPDRLNEGDTVYIRITVDELLPPETPDGSIYLVLGRRNQASGNSIIADEDDTAGLPVNIVAALKIATSTVVPVELTDDSLIELNERVFVTLAYDRQQVPFFRGRISGRFIVLDNDQTSFSIAPLSRVVYRENEAIELTVELPDGVTSTLDIQIRYRIKLRLRDADGRRVNTVNRDDIAGFLTGTVIIPAGETSAMFRIELTEDQLVEETELLGIRLQRPRVIQENGRTRGLRNAVTSEITVVSVIDNDRPTITLRSLRRTELVEVSDTSTSTMVTEGDSIRLVAEITNAPNGAAAATALNLGANTAGTTAYADDYWFPATVTIPTGSVRAVFTVNTFDDDVAEGDETLNIYVASVNYGDDSYSPPDSGFDLTIVDDDTSPAAQLNTSELTLQEGRAATITVDLSGDLSSLIDGDTSVLTIEARPVEGEETGLIRGTSDIYLPADLNDYELTPVTIDKQAGQATFEVRAVDDSDYDPLESVMLELVSQGLTTLR